MSTLQRIACIAVCTSLACGAEADPPNADAGTAADTTGTSGEAPPATTGTSEAPISDSSTSASPPDEGTTTQGPDPSAGSEDTGRDTSPEPDAGATDGGVAECEIVPGEQACTAPGYDGAGECDPYQQDCAEGFKCLPYDPDGGGAWNSTRCSPIVADPADVGEACTMTAGSATGGEDTCGPGLVCWNLSGNQGTCAEMCGCGTDSPTCEGEGLSCARINAGSVAVCSTPCVPSQLDACEAPQVCTITAGGIFHCVPASGFAAEGEPCASLSACQAGLFCAGSALCEGDTPCCVPFCDLDDPARCDTECTPFFLEDAPHECYDTLGACPAG